MNRIIIAIVLLLAICVSVLLVTMNFREQDDPSGMTVICTDRIDAVDSARYENYLVLYKTDFERNQHGYELLVDMKTGFVIDKGVFVEITDGAYVLSAHGDSAELLRKAEIGDIIDIRVDILTIKRDIVISNLKRIELEEQRVSLLIESRTALLYDIDLAAIEKADGELQDGKRELDEYLQNGGNDAETIEKKVQSILALIGLKSCFVSEYYAVEGRGMWHRPDSSAIKERTLEGVKEFADRLSELGINTLYLETYMHGMTVYYSDLLGVQHPKMASYDYGEYGSDYVLALISECHKRDIEVHAWVELLVGGFVGYGTPPTIKEEWICPDPTGSQRHLFLDPSNEEVRAYLSAMVTEMLEKYDFDGISYDYIRYPETVYSGQYSDNGFSENAIAAFSREYGYSGTDLASDIQNDGELRDMWHAFKQNAISETVRELSETVRRISPETVISASPYGYLEDAKSVYMQDIAEWIENGFLDVVLPMIYTENSKLLSDTAGLYNDYTQMVLQYTGISPLYNGADIVVNQHLIDDIKELNISGTSLFSSQNYIPKNKELSDGILKIMSSTTVAVAASMAQILKTNYSNFYTCNIAPVQAFVDSIKNSVGYAAGQAVYVLILGVLHVLFFLGSHYLYCAIDKLNVRLRGRINE